MRRGGNRRRAVPSPAAVPSAQELAARMRAMERRLTGFKTVPAENPPAFVQLPWNSFTFERTDTTSSADLTSTITVQDVILQIAAKCALATTPPDVANVRVKVQGAQVWCTVGSALQVPDIVSQFFELAGEVASSQQPRSTQRDLGTLNKPARVGYQYPSADRREIIAEESVQLKIVQTEAVEAGANITSRVQVLWQSSF